MEFSFLSTHDSSMYAFDKSQSFLQSYEIDSQFSDYSNVIDYQPNSKIVEICSEFREITKKGHSESDYLQMIKDYISNLQSYLDCTMRNKGFFQKNIDYNPTQISIIINNEIKTWKLMYNLYEDRFNMVKNSTLPQIRLSELQLVDDLYKHNTYLREAQIVVDWLEECTKEKTEKDANFLIGSHGKSWEHTKLAIRRQDDYMTGLNNVSQELDPDAPLRGCLNLSTRDKNDENEYLRYLFHCLQSGDSEKAIALCQGHDQWWRALSLEGWKPFHNPLLKGGNLILEQNFDVTGNPNRDLYKSVCWELSENSQLNIYERAIYAIFCGNISVLSMAVKDWDGLLWAHFKVYIEAVIDQHLHTFTNNGAFSTQSIFGEDDIDLSTVGTVGPFRGQVPMALSHEQIFEEVTSKLVHSPMGVLKGAGQGSATKVQPMFYQAVFEVVQQFLILNDLEGLISYIDLAISRLPPCSLRTAADKLVLRFLAHTVIFLFSTHLDMDMCVYHRVLEQYIDTLVEDRNLQNISFYVSRLSTDLQTKWYSRCMAGVTEVDEKRRCVLDGLEHHLDVVEISRLVVRSLLTTPDSSVVGAVDAAFVTDVDRSKIDALDWLTFLPAQGPNLLRQANALCRVFLESDKLQAARKVLDKVPRETVERLMRSVGDESEPRWLQEVIYEHRCLNSLVVAHDAFADWYSRFCSGKPAEMDFDPQQDLNKLSFQEKQMYQKKLEDHLLSVEQWQKRTTLDVDRVSELITTALKMGKRGWLSDVGEEVAWDLPLAEEMSGSASEDNDLISVRLAQIGRLQRKHVVSMCFLLMKVFSKSQKDRRCFELVNLVADEQLMLYQYFKNEQLQRFLQQVRQCCLNLMAEGQDPLGIEA